MKTLSKRQVIWWGKQLGGEYYFVYILRRGAAYWSVCVIEGGWGNLIWYINPLHPNIIMYILHTVLCMFSKVLTRGIWLAI